MKNNLFTYAQQNPTKWNDRQQYNKLWSCLSASTVSIIVLNISTTEELVHYHGCWCPGSLLRQATFNSDHARKTFSCCPWGTISTTRHLTVKKDRKCRLAIMFHKINYKIQDVLNYLFIGSTCIAVLIHHNTKHATPSELSFAPSIRAISMVTF